MSTPAKKFSKISLNAKPSATDPRPSKVNALDGVTPGKAITTANVIPKSQTNKLVSCIVRSAKFARTCLRCLNTVPTRLRDSLASRAVTHRTSKPATNSGKAFNDSIHNRSSVIYCPFVPRFILGICINRCVDQNRKDNNYTVYGIVHQLSCERQRSVPLIDHVRYLLTGYWLTVA